MSSPRTAVMDIAKALSKAFKKNNRSDNRKAWKALSSHKGKEEMDRLLDHPYRDVSPFHNLSFKEWLSESTQYAFVNYGDTDDDGLPENWHDQLQQVERKSGINILSDKELAVVAHENGKVLGGLYTSYDNSGEYSFDIIGEQGGNFVGMNLIKIGLDMFHDFSESNPDSHIKLDVRNQRLIPILQKRFGLEIVGQDKRSGATFMSPKEV